MPDLVAQLRAELAARPLHEAARCPSWIAYQRALARGPESALAAWLDDALRGAWLGQRWDERVERAMRGLAGKPEALALWRGDEGQGWSEWLGPFVLAYVGPESFASSRAKLGAHARLLAPERVLGPEDAAAWSEPEVERITMIPVETRAQGRALAELACAVAEPRFPGRVVREDKLSYGERNFFGVPATPELVGGRHGVVELIDQASLDRVYFEAIRELVGGVVIGPREVLASWPRAERARVDVVDPHRSRDRRVPREEAPLWRGSGVVERLRDEIRSRPLVPEALATCPSWPVLVDWLLSEGFEALASWLQAELDARTSPADPAKLQRADALAQFAVEVSFCAARPGRAGRLEQLWKARGKHSVWFGPFMVGYFDPSLHAGLGADELRLELGLHGLLLTPERLYTGIEVDWLDEVLRARRGATLVAVPESFAYATMSIANQLARRGGLGADLAETMRLVMPGRTIHFVPERVIATNVGPIASDAETTALICCESEDDIRRHAALWAELEALEHVIILASEELLGHWPYAHTRARPLPPGPRTFT